jgi:hypothetical protein
MEQHAKRFNKRKFYTTTDTYRHSNWKDNLFRMCMAKRLAVEPLKAGKFSIGGITFKKANKAFDLLAKSSSGPLILFKIL